jgi:hypothetical protein
MTENPPEVLLVSQDALTLEYVSLGTSLAAIIWQIV